MAAAAFASSSPVVGLGSSSLSSPKRTALGSSFVKSPVAARNPLRVAGACGGKVTCFERDWLRTDLNVIGFGLIGWLAPSSIPAINGKSLTGLFFESIGTELAHFPTPPPLTSQFCHICVLASRLHERLTSVPEQIQELVISVRSRGSGCRQEIGRTTIILGATKLEVEKFTGENDFHLWRLKMRALLVHQRLDVALDDESSSKKPMKVTEEELSEVLDRAHSAIILSLGDGVLREVGGEKTAAGLWKKLEDLYTKKSMVKRLATKKKLYTMQMEEGSSITDHIDAFNKIILDLEDINVKIDDEDKAMILLYSLPSSYENLVDTLMYERQTLAMGDVKEALSSKAAIKKETRDGEGLTARGRTEKKETSKNKKKRSKSRPNNLKCFHCHKEGHFKKDYLELKNKKNNANEMSGDAVVASEFEESDGYDSTGVIIATDAQTKGNWVLDSGCSFHMWPNKNLFTNYETCDGGIVVMGNDSSCRVVGRGSIRLKMFDGMIRELRDVRHVPDLKRNLISLGMLDKIGCLVKLESGTLKVLKGSMVVMKGNMSNGLYVLQGSAVTGDVAVSNQKLNKTMLWHMRLGHMSEKGLIELSKHGVLGVDKIKPLKFCEDCVLGKSSRVKFSTGIHNSKGTLDYIHADLWGPVQTASLGGARYFLSLIDDFSRMVWVFSLKSKDKVFDQFKNWKTLVETQTNRKVRRLRTDNGLEFCNTDFDDFYTKHGMVRHKTVKHTPQQNGLAERMNRTLIDKVRCMLIHSKLPMSLWAEALDTACYIVNMSPSSRINFRTPYELWSSKPVDYSHLRIFGCPTYAHVKQGKLELRAFKCVFLGYPAGVKSYKLWCIDMKPPRAIISRDVVFNEHEMFQNSATENQTIEKEPGCNKKSFLKVELPSSSTEADKKARPENAPGRDLSEQEGESEDDDNLRDYQLVRNRKKRESKPPKRYAYADLIAFALSAAQRIEEDEPKTYTEAVSSKDSKKWIAAMNEEMRSLIKNHTWDLIPKPAKKKVVGCKWIYKIKKGIPGVAPLRFKARLVAKGFTQKEEIDFNEMDVKTAFIHGELEEMIVMAQPRGYEDPDKANYINELKKQLKNAFEMKDLGAAKKILGVELLRDSKKEILKLSQHCYIKKVLERFEMVDSKPVQTPLPAHFRLSCNQCPRTEDEKAEMSTTLYSSAVGCLMYAMVLTRPDISHAVSVVSRYMANPGNEHWRAMKWILRYLSGTADYGLIYGAKRGTEVDVEGYVDADYVGDLDKRRSLTGYLFTLSSCTINWKASLQSVVTLSTTEAEYTAAAEAFKEAIWLRGMVTELGFKQKQVAVHCDSQSAICLSKN
ncbi:hypothetical protein KPL71_024410 [Citrus sinensis]|uniref:Uncharacterized protein n=1 Tax=Citrus sinensis TaxID=2711 RepID=A0ACB8IR41_CITSI|nr:hypothetical protein KPL71_024410 [Citrus sinensis]